jgi:hypothetical protein
MDTLLYSAAGLPSAGVLAFPTGSVTLFNRIKALHLYNKHVIWPDSRGQTQLQRARFTRIVSNLIES